MNACFVQVDKLVWLEVSHIERIEGGGIEYVLVLETGDSVCVTGVYTDNISRMLRAMHFGQLVLKEDAV